MLIAKFTRGSAIGLMTLLTLLGTTSHASGAPQPLDSIVAVVNDDVIVRSELNGQVELFSAQIRGRGTPLPERGVLEKQVLERMIGNRLQLQRAKELGIEVDDSRLLQAITGIAERNNMTIDQLRSVLAAEGINFNQFREDTRMQLITGQLQSQEVMNRIVVTEQEIDLYVKDIPPPKPQPRLGVHLLHILVAVSEEASPEEIKAAKKKADRIVAKLRGGADFAQVAVAESDGRQALEGGDLGWFEVSKVPTIAVGISQTLERGAVSNPIRSPSGFHVFKMADYKGGEPPPRTVVTETQARHILIKTSELVSDDEARTRLEQLRLRLVGGEDFATLARAHSDDTASAIRGGELGWLGPGNTVPEFERAMSELAPGDISEPFKTSFGWHLVQVQDRRKEDKSDQLLRDKAEAAIKQRKAEESIELWLRRLRAEAYVEVRLEDEGNP
jgi:peptidyl-prolyl cis-trans isomerase SurA